MIPASSYSQFPNKTKTFKNTCLIMLKWAINSKIQNKMPPCLMAKQCYFWHRSNVSVLLAFCPLMFFSMFGAGHQLVIFITPWSNFISQCWLLSRLTYMYLILFFLVITLKFNETLVLLMFTILRYNNMWAAKYHLMCNDTLYNWLNLTNFLLFACLIGHVNNIPIIHQIVLTE